MNTQSLGIQRTMSPARMPNHKIFFAYVKYTFNIWRRWHHMQILTRIQNINGAVKLCV